jgi:hypothetical protein
VSNVRLKLVYGDVLVSAVPDLHVREQVAHAGLEMPPVAALLPHAELDRDGTGSG